MTSKAVVVQGKKMSNTVTAEDFKNEVTVPDLLGLTSTTPDPTPSDVEPPIGVSKLIADTERVLSNYDPSVTRKLDR